MKSSSAAASRPRRQPRRDPNTPACCAIMAAVQGWMQSSAMPPLSRASAPPAEHPNASKRRRMLYRSLLDFASRRAERSNFGTPIAPHEDLQERCPLPGSFIVMRPCGLQATDMARRGSSLAAGHTTNARTCRAMAAGRRRPSSSYLSCACGTVARQHPIRLCAAPMSPSGFDATFSNATKRKQLTNICGGIAARAGSNWRSNTWTKK